jgi:hypothetical protein
VLQTIFWRFAMPHVRLRDDEHAYVVEGSGAFPFDKLRRDRSWASITEDALKLTRGEHRQITLIASRARDVAVSAEPALLAGRCRLRR